MADFNIIVGGEVEAGFPSVGRVCFEYPDLNKSLSCTGTLIHPQWFLSAAHCVLVRADQRRVTYISFEYKKPGAGNRMQTLNIPVEAYYVHGEYDLSEQEVGQKIDVALFKLSRPVTEFPFSKIYFQPELKSINSTSVVRYSDERLRSLLSNALEVGNPVKFVGYGETSRYKGDFLVKHSADLDIDAVKSRRFYAYVGPQGQMVCNGDSGGPAFIYKNETPYVAGIVSTGDEYCKKQVTCTRVDRFVPLFANLIGYLDTSSGRVTGDLLAQNPPLLDPNLPPNAQFKALGYGVVQKKEAEESEPSLLERFFGNKVAVFGVTSVVTLFAYNLYSNSRGKNL